MSETTPNPYEAPKADLNAQPVNPEASGSLEDALAGRYNFEIGDVMREAWSLTSGMKGAFWGAATILYLIYMVVMLVGMLVFKDSAVLRMIFNILLGAVAPVFFIGLIAMGLRRAAGLSVDFSTGFGSFGKAAPAFIAGLLNTVLTYIGILLLIIPGIYLAIGYSMSLPLIVDRNLSPWQALETSRKAVTKRWFQYFGLFFLVGLLVFLSAIPLGIGLIWTGPWAINVMGVVYRRTFGVAQAGDLVQTAGLARSAPSGTASLTLWAQDEATATSLRTDLYFLMGALTQDGSSASRDFLSAIKAGGTLSHRITPNASRGGYDVHLTVTRRP
jgi:hypothetical protein